MNSSESPLFRREVLEVHSNQWLGGIRLAQPVSSWLVAGFAIAISACLIAFVTFGGITRKARVAGLTVPSNGTLSIMSPNAGVLLHSYVSEGQSVSAGQTLFELSTERQSTQGEITMLVGSQLAIRQQILDSERRLRIVQDHEKRKSIDGRLLNINTEITQLDQEVSLEQRRRSLAQKSLGRYEELRESEYVSAEEAQQKQADLIDIDAHLSNLARTKVELQANRLSVEEEQRTLATALATDLDQLQNSDASLRQEVAENQNRKANLIVAPQAGTLTTITYQPGQAISAGQALATLIPKTPGTAGKDEQLEVHLYAPSRTAGFVAAGQMVLIRYQAYPYQKFGLQEGTIVDVSKTPFAPDELPINLASTILSNTEQNAVGSNSREALYRIKVRLKRQTISAYGHDQILKPGMTLDADIVQDERKLWEWIAEPVLAVAHR